MTTVITRYFEDAVQGQSARETLVDAKGLAPGIVSVFDSPEGLADALASAEVKPRTAEAYQEKMQKGGAVVMVRAGYKPLGVAKTVRKVLSEMGAAEIDGLVEEVTLKQVREPVPSILSDHPLMMTSVRQVRQVNRRTGSTYHMANWPIPLLTSRRPAPRPVIRPHARMANWPIGLLLPHDKRYGRFPFDLLIPGQKFMANFPFGHIIPGHKHMAGFPFGHIVPGHKFMANFPFGHIVPGHKRMAGFPFGHIVPGHRHMANWPFPLLINGKTGTNALIPGGPRMANFPIPLISRREPADKFAFPRHKRMANFPIPLLSDRKPVDKFAFPRHKRMADFPLPLVVRREGSRGFSLSKMFGWPTIIRR